MIIDPLNNQSFPEYGEILKLLPFKFYLTGSRYFGTETEESDWDVFAQDDGYLRYVLEQNGFEKEKLPKYTGDSLCDAVYKKENIYVQLVNNVTKKRDIQFALIIPMYSLKPDKNTARILWKLAVEAYERGQAWEKYNKGKENVHSTY